MADEQTSIQYIGLTLDEAAKALRVDSRTMRTLIQAGKVKAVKAGKGWRIHPDAIAEWMKGGTPDMGLETWEKLGEE